MTESARRPRVMIVEDFVLIQENIRLVLERDCDVVATAEDGKSALAGLAEFKPDIVTLDISLPPSSGFALARSFSQTAPGTSVIFVTAHGEKMYIDSAFDSGARGYVLKGAIQTELPAAIRKVAEGGRYLSPVLRTRASVKRRPGSLKTET